MKIKPEHFEYIKSQISKLNKDQVEMHFHALESMQGTQHIKDINMRFRWDCLWASNLSQWISDNVYRYANDNHIDTALRLIMKDLSFPGSH